MSDSKNFNLKVPKTKGGLVKEILKRWWYARDFRRQAQRAFGYSQIESHLAWNNQSKSTNETQSLVISPEEGITFSLVNVYDYLHIKHTLL